MIINQNIDIEDEVRQALAPYMTAYCRPMPAEYETPHILITQVGGAVSQTISTFDVVLDARAEREAQAIEYLNRAIGILEQTAKEQTLALRHVTINSSGSWGVDPVRPDLCICSARLEIIAHQQKVEV